MHSQERQKCRLRHHFPQARLKAKKIKRETLGSFSLCHEAELPEGQWKDCLECTGGHAEDVIWGCSCGKWLNRQSSSKGLGHTQLSYSSYQHSSSQIHESRSINLFPNVSFVFPSTMLANI